MLPETIEKKILMDISEELDYIKCAKNAKKQNYQRYGIAYNLIEYANKYVNNGLAQDFLDSYISYLRVRASQDIFTKDHYIDIEMFYCFNQGIQQNIDAYYLAISEMREKIKDLLHDNDGNV